MYCFLSFEGSVLNLMPPVYMEGNNHNTSTRKYGMTFPRRSLRQTTGSIFPCCIIQLWKSLSQNMTGIKSTNRFRNRVRWISYQKTSCCSDDIQNNYLFRGEDTGDEKGKRKLSFSYRLSTDSFQRKKTGLCKPLLFLLLGKNNGAFFQLTLLLDSSMADSNALSFSFFRNPCRKGETELQP